MSGPSHTRLYRAAGEARTWASNENPGSAGEALHLAVADWLEWAADRDLHVIAHNAKWTTALIRGYLLRPQLDNALAVAFAYLGPA